MKFIKLTSKLEGKLIIVNADHIEYAYESCFYDDSTEIVFNKDESICVRESIESVLNILNSL